MIAILTGCLSGVSGGSSPGQVTMDVDRFTGARTLKLDSAKFPMRGSPGSLYPATLQMTALATGNGSLVAFVFSPDRRDKNSMRDWEYLRCHDFQMLADGSRVPLGPDAVRHDGSVGSLGAAESVIVTMPAEYVRRIASSSRVEFRICIDEFEFTGPQLQTLRRFASRLPAPPTQASAEPGPTSVASPSSSPSLDAAATPRAEEHWTGFAYPDRTNLFQYDLIGEYPDVNSCLDAVRVHIGPEGAYECGLNCEDRGDGSPRICVRTVGNER